jgi:hypothetical protein
MAAGAQIKPHAENEEGQDIPALLHFTDTCD